MTTRINKAKYPLFIFALLAVVSVLAGMVAIYFLSFRQTENTIKDVGKRVTQDISYKNGKWDLSTYHADPEVPGSYRLYLIASNGYVIERWRPIPGYLDTSDTKNLLNYTTPTTIHTITGQNWRLFTQPVIRDGQQLGIVTAANSNVENARGEALDARLIETTTLLQERLKKQGEDGLSVIDNLDERTMPYDISVQVVDRYNHILMKNSSIGSLGGMPNYIDPSYVQKELEKEQRYTFVDTKKGENFLILSWPILDTNHNSVGTLIIARTVTPIYDLIAQYAFWFLSVQAILFTGAWLLICRLTPKYSTISTSQEPLNISQIDKICFSKSNCTLYINQFKIPLTFATNQYYLCEALFSNPKKKWETDVLLERFGEELRKYGWRKIYDAMAALNKKTSEFMSPKLITVNNKAYQLNPDLHSKIQKQKM